MARHNRVVHVTVTPDVLPVAFPVRADHKRHRAVLVQVVLKWYLRAGAGGGGGGGRGARAGSGEGKGVKIFFMYMPGKLNCWKTTLY